MPGRSVKKYLKKIIITDTDIERILIESAAGYGLHVSHIT